MEPIDIWVKHCPLLGETVDGKVCAFPKPIDQTKLPPEPSHRLSVAMHFVANVCLLADELAKRDARVLAVARMWDGRSDPPDLSASDSQHSKYLIAWLEHGMEWAVIGQAALKDQPSLPGDDTGRSRAVGIFKLLSEALRRFTHSRDALQLNTAVNASGNIERIAELRQEFLNTLRHEEATKALLHETGEAGDGAPKPAKRRPKRTDVDKHNDEAKIALYLLENPNATREEVAKATKIAPAHVSTTRAWVMHKASKRSAAGMNRARGRGGNEYTNDLGDADE